MLQLQLLGSGLLQSDDGGAMISLVMSCCWLIIAIMVIAGFWQTFTKAGEPGWYAIIPIFNVYIMLKIVGRPGWWVILYFIPFVNFVIGIIVAMDMAKSFDLDPILWGVILLFFLAPIGYLMLGFGQAQYKGPAAA